MSGGLYLYASREVILHPGDITLLFQSNQEDIYEYLPNTRTSPSPTFFTSHTSVLCRVHSTTNRLTNVLFLTSISPSRGLRTFLRPRKIEQPRSKRN